MDVRNKLSKVFKVLRKIILNLEILIYTQINYQSTVRIKIFSNMHNSENSSFTIPPSENLFKL